MEEAIDETKYLGLKNSAAQKKMTTAKVKFDFFKELVTKCQIETCWQVTLAKTFMEQQFSGPELK